jgi:CBS domain-containing protein
MGRYGGGDYGRRYGGEPGWMRRSRGGYGGRFRGAYAGGGVWGGREGRGYEGYDAGMRFTQPPQEWGYAGPPRARWTGSGGDGWASGHSSGDVDRIRAADIMTPNPEALTPDTPVAEIARRMRDLDVGVIPIVDDHESSRLQGIVTDRDIAVRVAAEGKDAKKTLARDIMSPDVQSVGESDHIRDVFAVMKRARVRRVPVTDADGHLVGIIAQADLAVNYAGLDLQRETEVEEVIERISEPARPRWGREVDTDLRRRAGVARLRSAEESHLPDRLRQGWRALRREARHIIGRGYDRGWR